MGEDKPRIWDVPGFPEEEPGPEVTLLRDIDGDIWERCSVWRLRENHVETATWAELVDFVPLTDVSGAIPMSEIELDRPRVEGDRFIVLLACGHWVHTRDPGAEDWMCPVISPANKNDGMQPAAESDEGERAILQGWEYYR